MFGVVVHCLEYRCENIYFSDMSSFDVVYLSEAAKSTLACNASWYEEENPVQHEVPRLP